MLSEFDKNNIIDIFINMCCKIDLLGLLTGFSCGKGCGINDIVLIFSDDPDENDPNKMRDYPELEYYEGVGFFCTYFPSPLLVSYQGFYDHLKLVVEKYIWNKDIEYQEQVQAKVYLEAIKNKYKFK